MKRTTFVLGLVIAFVCVTAVASGSMYQSRINAASNSGSTTLCSDIENIDIIFILDCSGSMLEDAEVDGSTATRLEAAKTAAKEFIDLLPAGANTRVGVVSYETYGMAEIEQSLTTDFDAAKDAIDEISIRSEKAKTSIGEGIKKGISELQAHESDNPRVFVLLTDGIANDLPQGWSQPPGWSPPADSWEPAELYALYEAHVAMTFDPTNPAKTYTIGVGDQTSINEKLLNELASSSGGKYFFAGTTSISTMFKEIATDICAGDVEVLIIANFRRMEDLGYDSASVNTLKTKLQDLADNNPNGRGVLTDLDTIASVKTAYANWDGYESDIEKTNALVQAIDNYIEDLKQNRYPKIKYVILVGSHEIIPMKVRPDDYTFEGRAYEKKWSNSLPKKSGYLYDIYHEGTDGHYLTDTIYGDLSYRSSSPDDVLTPELAVGRLVEGPDVIMGVIDTYMKHRGIVAKNNLVSIGAHPLVTDSAKLAADYMDATGVAADRALIIDSGFSSSLVPPKLNNKDVIYIGTHADYNIMWTFKGNFMAGSDPTEGDTSELSGIDNAVIATVGCHGGVNFGNKLYHAPDAGTTYSEFPEEFAKKGVVTYTGNTGYGVGGTKFVGYSEKISTDFLKYLFDGRTTGEAFTKAANEYSKKRDFRDIDRRALAIYTLYGIPTAKDPIITSSTHVKGSVKTEKGMTISSLSTSSSTEKLIIEIDEYQIDPTTGIVEISGATQEVNFNEPIMPVLFREKTLPMGSSIDVSWDQSSSESIIIENDLPIAGIYNSEIVLPGNFTADYFFPTTPFFDYGVCTLGGGGNVVGFGFYPVQYKQSTRKTKIWTKMVFDIKYDIPETGISVVDLSTDKNQYSPDETVSLNISILNKGTTKAVGLSMTMRDADTGDELATVDIGPMGLAGGTTTSAAYSIDLKDISQITGETIEGELHVRDLNNDSILASACVSICITSATEPMIAFVSDRDGNDEIYVMDADGSNQKRLTYNTDDDGGLAWSPDGKRIAFVSYRDGNDEIYVMNADGSNQKRLTYNTDDDGGYTIAWSPDGKRIAFVSDRDHQYSIYEIYVMNADGSDQTRLTHNARGWDSEPVWSPDGKRIAFVSDRGGEEIYVMNTDGSDQTRLTYNTYWDFDCNPAWSPDGKRIAFVSNRADNRDGNYDLYDDEIYVMNADGSKQTRLTYNTDDDGGLAWSPDGKRIAFGSDRDGNREIYVMNTDGSDQTRLTYNTDLDWCPVWSPDGKRIAFGSDRDGNYEIYVMNADGSKQTCLTYNSASDRYPIWSPTMPVP